MNKFVKFEVPGEVLGDFIQQAGEDGFTCTTSGPNRRGEFTVSVPYDKDQDDAIEELQEYLDGLIEDYDAEEENEDDSDNDR